MNDGAASASAVARAAILPVFIKTSFNGDVEDVYIYCLVNWHIRDSHVTSSATLWVRLARAAMIALIFKIVEFAGFFAAQLSICSRMSVFIMYSLLPVWTIITSR